VSALRPAVRLTTVAGTCLGLLLTTGQLASADGVHERTFADQQVVDLGGAADQSRRAAGLDYHQTHADHVTATNVAVAHTTCDGCRAVALSFQVVVADRGPTNLDVANVALALNEDCTGCESLAVAYQLVLATDDRAWLSGAGHRQLAQVRRELRALARSDAPLEEIQARAESLMADVTAAVSSNLRVRPQVRCDQELHRKAAAPHGDAQGSGQHAGHQAGHGNGHEPSRAGGHADHGSDA
jgi:hypothetical protein